jgi:hypothetical protein
MIRTRWHITHSHGGRWAWGAEGLLETVACGLLPKEQQEGDAVFSADGAGAYSLVSLQGVGLVMPTGRSEGGDA